MTPSLIGRRARRIDMPAKGLVAITLGGASGTDVLVFRLEGSPRGAGLVDERPRGAPAGAFTRRLRKLLQGSVLKAMATNRAGRLVLHLRRGDETRALILDADRDARHLWVLDESGRLVAALDGRTSGTKIGAAPPSHHLAAEDPVDEEELRARGATLISGAEGDELAARKKFLSRALRSAEKRLKRRLDKIAADAKRAEQAEPARTRASLIVSNLHAYEEGSGRLAVVDWTTDPPTERVLEIDPALGPKAEADALFHRARRLTRGAEKAAERKAITVRELATIRTLRERLSDVEDDAALESLVNDAARAGVRRARKTSAASGRKKADEGRRRPYRRFSGQGDRTILVGRGAADNDALTLRHAKPSDLWLHARGLRGAHVIVPLSRKEACPPELLLDAATLAVHFSAAAGEDRVEVQHTPRRYVRKPRGAAPGAVMVDRERVVILRHEPDRLARLLASEEHE